MMLSIRTVPIFRDWLRTHPEDRAVYAACKRKSAAENPMSMSTYVSGKAPVIVEILKRTGLTEVPRRPR